MSYLVFMFIALNLKMNHDDDFYVAERIYL